LKNKFQVDDQTVYVPGGYEAGTNIDGGRSCAREEGEPQAPVIGFQHLPAQGALYVASAVSRKLSILAFRSLQMMMKQADPRMRMTKQKSMVGQDLSHHVWASVNTLSRICCCLTNEASGRLRCGLLLAAYEYSAAGGRDSV
jgi:hypothetical protein